MIKEAVIDGQLNKIEVGAPNKKENLKQRAYLNSLSSMIDYAGAQITGFIINPFIVGGLGSAMYGVWQMLGQMTGYAKMADTRATQVLKWSLASKRDIAQEEELKSDVTTALIVTLISLPFAMIIGGLISWYAPLITQTEERYFNLIRATCAILIFCLIINKVFDLFESVLGGMNLGYKRMGVRTVIIVLGGSLKVAVISKGYGLIGLSVVQVFVALITGLTFYFIVKKQVPWFKFGKTNLSKIKSFGKLSGWFMAFSTLKMFLLNSDKILLGFFVGPLYVSKYALTMFTSHAVQGALVSVITGVTPGVSSLFGKKEFEKVKQARQSIISLIWLLTTSIGVTILLCNKSFISLWVGDEHYAGVMENLLIMLVAIQVIFFQLDSFIINVTLDLKKKVFLTAAASAVTIILAYFLVSNFEIIGLCISILIGRLVLTFGFPLILNAQMNNKFNPLTLTALQPFIISGILFLLATYYGNVVDITNWFYLILFGCTSLLVVGFAFWFLGIEKKGRKATWNLISKINLLKLK